MQVPRVLVEDYLAFVDDSAVAILPHALRIAAELGVAELFTDGPVTVFDLATTLRVDADALNRLLRALASAGFFVESPGHAYALTDLGDRLRHSHANSARASLLNADSSTAWHRGIETITSGRPVFGGVHGADFFAHKSTDSSAGQMFLRRMRERAGRLYPNFADVVRWPANGVVMDLGGGDGYLLSEVLRTVPHLSGILFDRPAVIGWLQANGGGPPERCRLVSGDFFTAVPSGADVHILGSVLHDWTDEEVRIILENSRRALAPNGRLLIIEMLVREDGSWHPALWSDLGMMVLTGGRERTAEEFGKLLTTSGFDVEALIDIPDSYLTVIEASPA